MKFIIVVNRGAVTGGGLDDSNWPDDGGGGGNVISTEGNARALHFSPAPAGLDFFMPLGPGFGPIFTS